jgi:membrane-associated phospholipid phosphatase
MSSAPVSRHRRRVPAGSGHDGPLPGGAGAARRGLAGLVAGAVLAVCVLILGVVAKMRPVAALDLRVDEHIALHDRAGALTALAKVLTDAAKPETVGVGLMIIVPLILVLARRRADAVKVLCMFGGAFALAEIGKKLIGEHRPPASLQAMAADASPSYPSGHAATAAVLAVALAVVAAAGAWRYAAIVLGGLYAVAVAGSRVYLGDHYPLDVIGGMLCALAAGFAVTGLAALPAVQSRLRRLDAPGRRAPAPPPPARPGSRPWPGDRADSPERDEHAGGRRAGTGGDQCAASGG